MIRSKDFNTETARVIHRSIFNPATAIFKQSRRERAECTTIRCCCESCPLLAAKTCAYVPVIGWNACPYGEVSAVGGPTKRAHGMSRWIAERKAEYPDVPALGWPANKMAFVGEYVYLPYAYMNMHKAVSFLEHADGFTHGNCFLPCAAWSLGTVLTLLDFHPQALFGGEIVAYQQEEIPKFLTHLRECAPEMWQELIAARPEHDKPANHVGRKALLRTLKAPIEWSIGQTYPVQWRWDGARVTTKSPNAYDQIWGKLKLDSVVIEGVPSADAVLVVQDNSWVGERTSFVD